MQQQRVLLGRGVREVPDLVFGESLGLRVDAEMGVVGDGHVLGRVPPGRRDLGIHAQLGGPVGMAAGGVRRGHEVPLRHQVRVDVVVGDGRVLVRARDTVDPEAAVEVVMSQRPPQPGGLDQDRQPHRALELLVPGDGDVAGDRVGDVGVDVKGGRPGRPVPGALLAVDGAPGEDGALQIEQIGSFPGQWQSRVPPAQRVGRRVRRGVRQDGEHVRLGVPEGVPVVSGAGQALGRDRPPLGPRSGLQDVEQREANGLLHLRVAVDLDVGPLPEGIQVLPLLADETGPPGLPRCDQRRGGLVPQGWEGPLLRPTVGDELDHP